MSPRQVDPEVLAGFLHEARGYLPRIREGADQCRPAAARPALEEAHRLAHLIKGSALMLGLGTLAVVAGAVDEALEGVHTGANLPGDVTVPLLHSLVDGLENALDQVHTAPEPPDACDDVKRWSRDLLQLVVGSTRPGVPAVPQAEDDGVPAPPEAPSSRASAGDSEALSDEFVEEAEDYLTQMAEAIDGLDQEPDNADALLVFRRRLHSLKGAAAVMKFEAPARLAHQVEDLLDRLGMSSLPAGRPLLTVLSTSVAALGDLIRGREPTVLPDLHATTAGGLATPAAPAEGLAADLPGNEPVVSHPADEGSQPESSPVRPAEPSIETPVHPAEPFIEPPDIPAAVHESTDPVPDASGSPVPVVTEERHGKEPHLSPADELFPSASPSDPVADDTDETPPVGVYELPDIVPAGADRTATSDQPADVMPAESPAEQDSVPAAADGFPPPGGGLTPALAPVDESTPVRAAEAEPDEPRELTLVASHPSDPAGAPADPPAAAVPGPEIAAAESTGPAAPIPAGSRFLRVDSGKIDELIRLSGEELLSRSMLEQRLSNLSEVVQEIRLSVERLQRLSASLDKQFEAVMLRGRHIPGPLTGRQPGSSPNLGATGTTMVRNNNALTMISPNPGANVIAPSMIKLNDSNVLGVTALPTMVSMPSAGHSGVFKSPLGFDALEMDRYTDFHLLTRELAETTSDLQTVGTELDRTLAGLHEVTEHQGRLARGVQDRLTKVRLIPLDSLESRLRRTVRGVAEQQGKQVEFVLEGGPTALDKTILEEMTEPLTHLLRNAVDHGVEPPEDRRAAGKPACGRVVVSATTQGNQVILTISDDGRGFDAERLKAVVAARGLLSPAEATRLAKTDLLALATLPGVSTAREVSEVSGRGLGLDIARSRVHALHGSLRLETEPGAGSTFTVGLPLNLSVVPSLITVVHGRLIAVPLAELYQVTRLDPAETAALPGLTEIRRDGRPFMVIHVGTALGMPVPTEPTPDRPFGLLVHAAGRDAALIVDQVNGQRELLLKGLGGFLKRIPGLLGASLLGDGRVILVLKAEDLVDRLLRDRRAASLRAEPTASPRPAAKAETLSVMVIDDSPSIRRVVTGLLKSEGWTVTTAKDGLDALEQLQTATTLPEVLLLDVEMPRLDGYGLLTGLRNQERLRDIPAVMLTSRAGEKHRSKAVSLGAAGYVVKPYQDADLLALIRQLVKERREQAAPPAS